MKGWREREGGIHRRAAQWYHKPKCQTRNPRNSWCSSESHKFIDHQLSTYFRVQAAEICEEPKIKQENVTSTKMVQTYGKETPVVLFRAETLARTVGDVPKLPCQDEWNEKGV